MKKSIYSLISIAALPFVLFSCMKDKQFDMPAPENLITIQGSIADPVTKVTAADAENGIDWNWEAGDQIAVISGESISVFDIRSGFTAKEASFIGKEIKGETFTIQYPGTYATEDAMKAISVLGQIQNGVNDKSHLTYFAQLSGKESYSSFSFAEEDPALKQCGVLRFSLVLPAETVMVSTVSLKAESPIFHSGNAEDALTDELSVAIVEGNLGADKAITAWMTTSWFDDEITAGTPLSVNVSAGDFNWTTDITPVVNKTLKSGYVNSIKVEDPSAWASGNRYADGDGTQENPWLVRTAKQLTYMRDDMVSKEMRYFKLVADLDMAGVEWIPLNNTNDPEDETKAYDKFIDFDGGGHTIYNLSVGSSVAYPSFAGVLYGTIKDVTFVNANIDGGENKSGVVAGYMGTSQNFTASVISGVVVKNATVAATRHVGALVGQVATGDNTITDCQVIGGTVTGAQYTAGFAGYIQNAVVTHCSTSATVSGSKNVGGFVGKTETPTITDCWYDGPSVTCSATGNNQSGGFVGDAGKSGTAAGVFKNCYVKGATLDLSAGQRIGGFAGQIEAYNVVTKCHVENVTLSGNTNTGGFVGVDYTGSAGEGAGVYQCHVEGGTVTAANQNCGGFVGYPEGATIQNCYTTMDVVGGTYAAIGGFVGIAKAKTTNIQYCYSAGTITGSNATKGAFAGNVDGDATTHINYCIAWNDELGFAGKAKAACDVSNNYLGKEGTISSQAAALGWDPDIWNFNATLK